MIEIKGKYNEAKIFTDVVDSASIAQVQELCNQEFTAGSRIRLMPDIHAGAGCGSPFFTFPRPHHRRKHHISNSSSTKT